MINFISVGEISVCACVRVAACVYVYECMCVAACVLCGCGSGVCEAVAVCVWLCV